MESSITIQFFGDGVRIYLTDGKELILFYEREPRDVNDNGIEYYRCCNLCNKEEPLIEPKGFNVNVIDLDGFLNAKAEELFL